MKVELLAPAGSFDSLKAAIQGGADAVYAGGTKFGARAYAKNFSSEEYLEAIDYVHIFEKKIYLTLNTLVKDAEFEKELYDYIQPLYIQGLDGIIIQDLGILNYVKKYFPNLEIHASTQMNITGEYGANWLKKQGVSRIVTARELSLAEIQRIHETSGVEIESFVHGSLCYCYSGLCMLSSMLGGRSANRGRCAGPCRLPYSFQGNEKKYLMSMKDLCTLEFLPEIIEAGVYSLKIEGRMKKTEYTKIVSSIYRKYIDLFLEKGKKGYFVEKKDLKLLMDVSSRSGYTKGYYKQYNGADMISIDNPSYIHRESETSIHEKKHLIQCEVYVYPGSQMVLKIQGEVFVEIKGAVPQEAQKAPLTEENLKKQLQKTKDTLFEFEKIIVYMDSNVFVPVSSLNELRRKGLEAYKRTLLEKYRRVFFSPEQSVHKKNSESTQSNGVKLSCLVRNLEAFFTVLEEKSVDSIYFSHDIIEITGYNNLVEKAHNIGKGCYLYLPSVFRSKEKHFFNTNQDVLDTLEIDGYIIRNMEEYGYFLEKNCKKMIADKSIYIYNQYAKEEMKNTLFDCFTVPDELNEKEMKDMGIQGMELVVYGKQELMYSAGCIKKTCGACDHKSEINYLTDRYNKIFPVKSDCFTCSNILFNGDTLSLLSKHKSIQQMKPKSLRLDFLEENPEEIRKVIGLFSEVFLEGKEPSQEINNFTTGHFRRGVE